MNKTLLLALAGVILLGATTYLVASQKGNNLRDASLEQEWKAFKKTYGKKYADPVVDNYRMEVFASNLQVVQEDTTGTYGVTQFFDLTPAEFQSTYLTLEAPLTADASEDLSSDPTSINWVTAGYVTAVKNQGSCGSCWAFSTTGSLESALIINGAATQSVDLSEQQLVDCSTSNSGCNGGLMDKAFTYIEKSDIVTETAYPYTGTKRTCQKGEITGTKYTLNGYTDVSKSTSALLAALQKQPVSIAVDATNWSYYKSGVFSNCGTKLNHGVLLVGFENNSWIVKNSWGASWGNAGYITLASGNTCGLANSASYPTGAQLA